MNSHPENSRWNRFGESKEREAMGKPQRQKRERTSDPDEMEQRARTIIESHSHFVGRARLFEFHYSEDVLVVRGCVPTYYLKQVLQSALKGIDGVRRIDNQVQVDTSGGVFESRGPHGD
jgi:hypothetical protein